MPAIRRARRRVYNHAVSFAEAVLAHNPDYYWRLHDADPPTQLVDLGSEATTGAAPTSATAPTYQQAGPLLGGQTTASILFDSGGLALPITGGANFAGGEAGTLLYFIKFDSTSARTGTILGSKNVAFTRPVFESKFNVPGRTTLRISTDTASTTNVDTVADTAMSVDNWYFIAITADGSTDAKIYINAVEDTITQSGPGTDFTTWIADMGSFTYDHMLGGNASPADYLDETFLSEVAFLPTALSLSQIQVLYAAAGY